MKLLRTSLRVPPARLLSMAILAMAALLVVKSGDLVRAATFAPSTMAQGLLQPRPTIWRDVHLAAVSSPPMPPAPQPTPPQAPPSRPPQQPAPAASPSAAGPTSSAGGAGAAQTSPTQTPPAQTPPPQSPPATAPPADPPISNSERKLLTELRQRRKELDEREAALAVREATLNAVDRRLTSRVEQLTALQHKLEALEQERKAHDEANWNSLVKTYETMKPRDAATIFNDLDLPVLLPVIDRMKEAKMAPILAAMQPERARLVTSELAKMRLRANRVDDNMPPPPAGANRPAGG